MRHHFHPDTPLANDLSQEVLGIKKRLPAGGMTNSTRVARVVAAHGLVIDNLITTIGYLEREVARLRRELADHQEAGSRDGAPGQRRA